MEVVAVRLLVVTKNLKHFRNKARSWPALDLDDDVERVRDVRLDGPIGHLNTTLQHTSREPRDALSGRIGMDSGDSAAVIGVEEL